VNPHRGSFQFSQRRNALAFWIGSAVVSVGVVLHLPMFWMARNSRFNMSGMPMDAGMLFGLLLIALSPFIPESARFLLHMGRLDEAHATLARFGAVISPAEEEEEVPDSPAIHQAGTRRHVPNLLGTIVALTLAALAWGLVNFGVLLWLPSALVAEGRSVGLASHVIARSTLIAAPTIVVSAYLYSVWSTKSSLILAIGITSLGLLGILLRGSGMLPILTNPIMPLSLLIVGSSAMVSILLPYAAESYPVRVRGRATGWVAGWSKIGGLIAQALSALALVPALGVAAAVISIPAALSLALIWFFGRETQGRDLRELESAAGARTDALR
jgi:MFS transporter, putative metabolite:H+ symporter